MAGVTFCVLTHANSSFCDYEPCLNVAAVKRKIKDFEANFEKEHGHKVSTILHIGSRYLLLCCCWMLFYFAYCCAMIDWVKVLHPTWLKAGHFRDVLPSQSWRGTQCRVMNTGVREQYPSFISQLVDEETMHLRDWLLSTRASSTWNKNFSLISPPDQEGIWLTQVHQENCR